MQTMRCVLGTAFLLLAQALLGWTVGSANAQEYPTKLITFVVPTSPGGAMDVTARVLAPEMSKVLGQPIIVENKPGRDFALAFDYVVKQVPQDGYTVVFSLHSSFATLPLFIKDLRFDPLRDLPPIIGIAEGRWVFGSSSKTPWKTIGEMVSHARANPGKLNYGASSTDARLRMEGLVRGFDIDVVYIPYRSTGSYLTALSAGEIQMGFIGENAAISFGEKFRVLAVTGEKRHPLFSEAPTFSELGYPQVMSLGYTLNGPSGMPRIAFDKLYAAALQVLQQPDVRARLEKIPLQVTISSPEAAAKRLAEEAKIFADLAKRVGIKPE